MLDLILPLSIAMALVSYSLIGKWYVMPVLRALPLGRALEPILLLHSYRYVGMAFLIPGVTSQALDGRFAIPAAYGDLLAGVLALLALLALPLRWRIAIPLVWLFNVEGFLDLINAVFQGLRYTADGDLGSTYFIPATLVPALIVSHIMVFILLLRADSAQREVKIQREAAQPQGRNISCFLGAQNPKLI